MALTAAQVVDAALLHSALSAEFGPGAPQELAVMRKVLEAHEASRWPALDPYCDNCGAAINVEELQA